MYECSPTVPLSSLSPTAQGVFLSMSRGLASKRLSDHGGPAPKGIEELVAAGYARLVKNRTGDVIEMAQLHDSFAMAAGADGSQNATVEIMPPEHPDYGDGKLLAVLTDCSFNLTMGTGSVPWPTATITAIDGGLTDDEDDSTRSAMLTIAQPLLIRSYGAHEQVWLGTLVKACLYPAGVDIAVASLRGKPEFEDRRYMPPEIPSVSPSIVRITVTPSKSFLAEHSGS